jgi:hypothetical protein
MDTKDLLANLPSPKLIHQKLGELYRELTLLRRMLRLAQAIRDARQGSDLTPSANLAKTDRGLAGQ